MTDIFTNSQYRAALGSINFNASNFQVFSFIIGISILVGLSLIAGGLVGIQSEDETLQKEVLYGFAIAMMISAIFLVIAYVSYMRNIGIYIYGRMKPFNFGDRPIDCAPSPTGTSRVSYASRSV
jgi:hypothetical protein